MNADTAGQAAYEVMAQRLAAKDANVVVNRWDELDYDFQHDWEETANAVLDWMGLE